MPDFPYFFFQSQHSSFGHTFTGMFALDLPLGVAALCVFHALIKQPLMLFLPAGIRRRLTTSVNTFRFGPVKRFSLIVLSVLVGAATHLAWDAFTHRDNWMYEHWAFLRRTVELPGIGGMEMYKLLEYASSAVGLAVVAAWIWHWYRTTSPEVAPPAETRYAPGMRAFVAVLPVVAIAGGALRAYLRDGLEMQIRSILHFAADLLMAAISILLLGLLVCGVILRQWKAVPVQVG